MTLNIEETIDYNTIRHNALSVLLLHGEEIKTIYGPNYVLQVKGRKIIRSAGIHHWKINKEELYEISAIEDRLELIDEYIDDFYDYNCCEFALSCIDF